MLAQTVELWGVPDNWDRIAGFYREALEDLPHDVAEAALKRARMRLKWLPKPSELREFADEEMRDRQRDLAMARREIDKWRDDLPPAIDVGERKQVGKLMGDLAKTLRGNEPGDGGKRPIKPRYVRMFDPELADKPA